MAAKQLKEQGNRLYAQGKVEAALEVYSQAIVSSFLLIKCCVDSACADIASGIVYVHVRLWCVCVVVCACLCVYVCT